MNGADIKIKDYLGKQTAIQIAKDVRMIGSNVLGFFIRRFGVAYFFQFRDPKNFFGPYVTPSNNTPK